MRLPVVGWNRLLVLDLNGGRCHAERYRKIRFDQPFDLGPRHHVGDQASFCLRPVLEPLKSALQGLKPCLEAGDQAQILFAGPDQGGKSLVKPGLAFERVGECFIVEVGELRFQPLAQISMCMELVCQARGETRLAVDYGHFSGSRLCSVVNFCHLV